MADLYRWTTPARYDPEDRVPRVGTLSEAQASGQPFEKVERVVGSGNFGVRREFMSQAERKQIFEATGVPVEDRADMRAAFKAKNLRDAEKGEAGYEAFDALKEHAETGRPLDERHHIRNIDLWGDGAPKKWDEKRARERYLYHCQQIGQKPNL